MKSKAPTELELACEEVARLHKCERLQDDNAMLDAALSGEAKTIDSVMRLMAFVAKYLPRGNPSAHWTCAVRQEADAFDRWWNLGTAYLTGEGKAEDQLPKKPPAAGEPDFVSVLSEFED